MAVALVTATAVAAAPLGVEWLAYAYSFRSLQRGAELIASGRLRKLVDPAAEVPIPYSALPYRLEWDHPPRSGQFAGRREALRARLRQEWRSPLFGVHHTIAASATAMLLPTDHAGEARIAIVE